MSNAVDFKVESGASLLEEAEPGKCVSFTSPPVIPASVYAESGLGVLRIEQVSESVRFAESETSLGQANDGFTLRKPIVLQPEITQEARSYLVGDLAFVNDRVMALCIEQARRMRVHITRLRLSIKRSWEGDFIELVLQAFVRANIHQSLALWDAVGEAIQRWEQQQSPLHRRLLNERYSVFLEPSSHS